jgi:hypothetical protein
VKSNEPIRSDNAVFLLGSGLVLGLVLKVLEHARLLPGMFGL